MQWNRVAPLALVGLLAAGCGQSKSTDAEIPVVEGMETEIVEAETPEVLFDDSKIFDLIRKVDGLHQAAQTNEANQVFFDALENPEFAPAADRVSNLMLRFMLFTEQTELAKAKFLALLRTAPEQALPSRDLIYGYLLETGSKEAATDWARALLAQDLPLEMRLTAADWVVNGLLTAGDRTGAVAAAKDLLSEFPIEDLASLYQRLAQNAISAGALDTAEAVYGMMKEKVTPETPKLQSAVCIVEIRLHTAKGEFAAIAEAAPSYLGKVPELAFSQAMAAAYRAAREAGNAAALDQLTSAVLLNSAFKNTRLIPSAAREWCAVPFLDKEMGPAAYPARLSKLVDLQVQPRTIFSIFSSHFYELIDDAALLKEMMAVADRIKPLLTQEADLALFKLGALCILVSDPVCKERCPSCILRMRVYADHLVTRYGRLLNLVACDRKCRKFCSGISVAEYFLRNRCIPCSRYSRAELA